MRFSYSQLNTYLKCPEQYNRRYVRGEKIPPGVAMLRGDGQHTAQAIDLTSKRDTGELAEEAHLLDVAADVVRNKAASEDDVSMLPEERELGFERVRDRTIDEAVRLTSLHHRTVAPLINPDRIEQRLQFRLPGLENEVVAYADVIERDGSIRDGKNRGKKPDDDCARNSDQLGLYAIAHRVLTGRPSPRQSLDVLVLSHAKDAKEGTAKTRRPAAQPTLGLDPEGAAADDGPLVMGSVGKDRAMRFEVQNTPDDQARVVLRMQEAAAAISAGFFPPAAEGVWWCSPKWCGYWPTCPYVRGGAVVSVPGVNTYEDLDPEDIKPTDVTSPDPEREWGEEW